MLAFLYDCCCDRGGGGAAAPVDYQRTVRRFPLKNVRHIVIQLKNKMGKHETLNKYKTAAEPKEISQPVRRFTYLPWAEVKRSSERGAAISLPLLFRARALESAAVASRSWTPTEMALFSHPVLLQQRQGNWRHSGSSRRRSFLDDTWYVDPQCPLPQSQFHSVTVSWMRHNPRSYLGNKANLFRPIGIFLIPPLGYCIRSPTSTLIICSETKVK